MRPAALPAVVGAGLAVMGTAAIVLGFGSGSSDGNDRYGASRDPNDGHIVIHWVLCDGEAPRSVDLEGYWGGSQLPTAVRVLWQVRSDAPSGEGDRVERYSVGRTPPGFYETVPLVDHLPHDLISIGSPPGDGMTLGGMSFRVAELRQDAIYRGDYEYVSEEQFAADGPATCHTQAGTPARAAGLLVVALGGLLLAGRRHPKLVLAAGGLLVGGVVATLGSTQLVREAFAPRQAAAAFGPSTASPSAQRDILLEISPDTARSVGGLHVARFLAPGEYAFTVSCDGPSIQIGESSELVNGETGSRQLIGCATEGLVNGGIAVHGDRSDVVEIVVDPHDMRQWRVVVVAGPGEIGPFDEP